MAACGSLTLDCGFNRIKQLSRLPNRRFRSIKAKPPTEAISSREPTQDSVQVAYEITGSAIAIPITMENNTNGTEQATESMPFKWTGKFEERNPFLYISAQILRPTTGNPEITCRILVDGVQVAKTTASGFASIATCDS